MVTANEQAILDSLNPSTTPNAMESTTNAYFYDRISRFYDDIAHASESKATQEGWRMLAVKPGERILEIGFGTGHSIPSFAESVGENGHVTGIDISSGMREVATARVADAGMSERVSLILDAVPPIDCEAGSFDAVFLSFTLELFPLTVIPEVLQEVRRVLTPKGRLGVVCMEEIEAGQKESRIEHAYKWMHRHFPHIVDCQPISSTALLEESGFRIGEVVRLEIWGLPVAVTVASVS